MGTDVTDHDQVKLPVDAAVALHRRINVIVNNAGLMPHSPLERGKVDDWGRMIHVNLKSVLYVIAAGPVSSSPTPQPAFLQTFQQMQVPPRLLPGRYITVVASSDLHVGAFTAMERPWPMALAIALYGTGCFACACILLPAVIAGDEPISH